MKSVVSTLLATAACLAGAATHADQNATVIRKVAYQPVIAELAEEKPFETGSTQKLGHRVYTRRPGCTTHFPGHIVSYPSGGVVTSISRVVPGTRPSTGSSKTAELTVGSVVTAPTNFLGTETGFVLVKVGPATHECTIINWGPRGATFEVPEMGLSARVSAELQLVRPDGDIVRTYRVTLVRKPDLIVHEESPATPSFDGPSAGGLKKGQSVSTGGLVLGPAS